MAVVGVSNCLGFLRWVKLICVTSLLPCSHSMDICFSRCPFTYNAKRMIRDDCGINFSCFYGWRKTSIWFLVKKNKLLDRSSSNYRRMITKEEFQLHALNIRDCPNIQELLDLNVRVKLWLCQVKTWFDNKPRTHLLTEDANLLHTVLFVFIFRQPLDGATIAELLNSHLTTNSHTNWNTS